MAVSMWLLEQWKAMRAAQVASCKRHASIAYPRHAGFAAPFVPSMLWPPNANHALGNHPTSQVARLKRKILELLLDLFVLLDNFLVLLFPAVPIAFQCLNFSLEMTSLDIRLS